MFNFQDFRPKAFDILLTDIQLSNTDNNKSIKTLPKTTISYETVSGCRPYNLIKIVTSTVNPHSQWDITLSFRNKDVV